MLPANLPQMSHAVCWKSKVACAVTAKRFKEIQKLRHAHPIPNQLMSAVTCRLDIVLL